jgi:hypothetical protein
MAGSGVLARVVLRAVQEGLRPETPETELVGGLLEIFVREQNEE